MFLVGQGKTLAKAMGVSSDAKIRGLDYSNVQTIRRKDQAPIQLIKVLNKDLIPNKVLKKCEIKSIDEYTEYLESVKELAYHVYNETLLNKSLETIDLPDTDITVSEQERLKALQELGVWGIKHRDNLPRVQDRWS